jgi:CheY-like chemotaxis protein
VEFNRELGAGTELRLFFPRASVLDSQAVEPAFKETILLVEPDDKMRGAARFILSRHGYRVIEADSAATAEVLWEVQGPKVDLLLTDFPLVTGHGGAELAERLRRTRPNLKVVYTSGSNLRGEEIDQGLISKPFSPVLLVQTVQSHLASALPASSLPVSPSF